ncbi:MAG: HAD family phosphatase [Treponema sp.]|nr:HAD family phosphatase [Treponema sp.]
MSIKAVVFDYGGVLCYPPSAEIVVELERLTGLEPARLDDLNRKYRGNYDRGDCNGEEYFRRILSSAGVFLDEASLREIARTDMEGYKRMNTGAIQLMRDVKRAGVKTAILSNMPVDFLVWAREHVHVIQETDAAIFSCEHYLLKPETAIFEKLKEELGMDYTEMAFFDDLPENIIRACELGINGFVWINSDDARKTLKKTDTVFTNL